MDIDWINNDAGESEMSYELQSKGLFVSVVYWVQK